MAGILEYFHGEKGTIGDVLWVPSGDKLNYLITMGKNPLREAASDYGADIGVDPQIKSGDRVTYLRLDNWSGIWVRVGNRYYPDPDRAYERVIANRRRMDAYRDHSQGRLPVGGTWLNDLTASTGVEVRADDRIFDKLYRPSESPSVFLSYRSHNLMMARTFLDHLRRHARLDVWSSHEHYSEAPATESEIARWLEARIQEARIFVVLLTQAALDSDPPWVSREIEWACRRAEEDRRFHLVLLKLEDVAVPELGDVERRLVDCRGMTRGEIIEEIFAAVFRWEGRREWLEEQRERRWPRYEAPSTSGYEHLHSDGGRAKELCWRFDGREPAWELVYERDGVERRARGTGKDGVVDPEIRPGDNVGYLRFGENELPIWMRSTDPDLRPGDVIGKYNDLLQATPIETPARVFVGSLAHSFALFGLAALGLLVGKLAVGFEISWPWILGLWVATWLSMDLMGKTAYRSMTSPSPLAFWRTKASVVISLLMGVLGLASGSAVIARAGGWLDVHSPTLLGLYATALVALGGITVLTFRIWNRRLTVEVLGDPGHVSPG